jgi:hypothetical protein
MPTAGFEPSDFHILTPVMGFGGFVDQPGAYARGGTDFARGGFKGIGTRGYNSMGRFGMPHPHRGGARLITAATPGRTDRIRQSVKPGSYIVPADVVSALGQGNTMAGAKMFGDIISSGPYGQSIPKVGGGGGAPPKPQLLRPQGVQSHMKSMPAMKMPKAPKQPTAGFGGGKGSSNAASDTSDMPDMGEDSMAYGGLAYGGEEEGGEGDNSLTPIVTAGGELVIDPEVLEAYGDGDLEVGKEMWANLVTSVRQQNIDRLRKLPGPIK